MMKSKKAVKRLWGCLAVGIAQGWGYVTRYQGDAGLDTTCSPHASGPWREDAETSAAHPVRCDQLLMALKIR